MSRILIVDDDRSIHMTIAGILRKEGHEVGVVEDGYKAIELLSSKSYDIALMDIRMPGINGVETMKRVKEISPETTVIMMTAYAVDELREEAVREGAFNILDKPFDMQKVINMLSDIGVKSVVLVIDDNPGFRDGVKINLEKMGFKAMCAESGEAALRIIERKSPDVILLDCRMPGLTGTETLQKLNSAFTGLDKKPEVILVSGYDDRNEIDKAFYLGAKKFLAKPLDLNELKKSIEELLECKTESCADDGLKMLVVEKGENFEKTFSDTLAAAGYTVSRAEDGKKALEILKQNRESAVLLDMTAPDVNSLEVYEKLREEHPGIKVIMMTGYSKVLLKLIGDITKDKP